MSEGERLEQRISRNQPTQRKMARRDAFFLMAGPHDLPAGFRPNPAIDRLSAMRENTHLYFRMTRKKAPIFFLWGIGLPVAAFWLVTWSTCKSEEWFGREPQHDLLFRCYICPDNPEERNSNPDNWVFGVKPSKLSKEELEKGLRL